MKKIFSLIGTLLSIGSASFPVMTYSNNKSAVQKLQTNAELINQKTCGYQQ